MRKLKIKHVGPVREAEVTLHKFNFFIGPQSSGKSTIAKILSTCMWIEKEAVTSGDSEQFTKQEKFLWHFVFFHKMDGYFRNDSEITYESEYIKITYCDGVPTVEIKDGEPYWRFKICYIPAERNLAALPEVRKVEFGETNIRSFLFDWSDARESFDEQNKLDILHLGEHYFFDSDALRLKDRITLPDEPNAAISLGCASSGLQSVTPLLISMKYYSGQYFHDYGKKDSLENKKKTDAILDSLYIEREVYKGEICDDDCVDIDDWYESAVKRLTIPHQTSFVVEEPEQNLFPDTQSELLDEMVRLCSGERKHELTVTTHSPYILNQLNLMFKRHDAGDSETIGLNYDDVSVYAVDNGGITDLKVKNAHLVNPEYLSAPIDRIYEKYDSYGSR